MRISRRGLFRGLLVAPVAAALAPEVASRAKLSKLALDVRIGIEDGLTATVASIRRMVEALEAIPRPGAPRDAPDAGSLRENLRS